MATSQVTSDKVPGDVVLMEEGQYYSRVNGTIIASQTVVVGSLLIADGTSYKVAANGEEASIVGIALEKVTTDVGETAEIPVMTRDAIVDATQLDVTTATLTLATVITRLLTLGIRAMEEDEYETLARTVV